MKSLVMALVVVFAPYMASAVSLGSSDFPVTDYISWCDDNKVIYQTYTGELALKADCSEQGLTCKQQEVYRGRGLAVTAYCSDKRN